MLSLLINLGDAKFMSSLQTLNIGDEMLTTSPLKRKKRIEYLAEKLHGHNTSFLGNLSHIFDSLRHIVSFYSICFLSRQSFS